MASTTVAGAAVPGVLWAQRPKCIFLTMDVSDCKEHDIRLEKDSLHFKGRGGPDAKEFEINMKFLKEIDPDKSKYAVRPRAIEFALGKEEQAFLIISMKSYVSLPVSDVRERRGFWIPVFPQMFFIRFQKQTEI
jgi:CS domain